MLHNTFCLLAALAFTLAVAVSIVPTVFAVYPMPVQTATETAVYLFNAGQWQIILFCRTPGIRQSRSAFTGAMTACRCGKRQGPER